MNIFSAVSRVAFEMSCADDFSLTPAGASNNFCDPNVTYRKKIPIPMATDAEITTVTDQLQSSAADIEVTTVIDVSLTSEIRSLRQEVSLLRDQLSKAVLIIASYDTKLESYASHVEVLHGKLEKCEVFHSSATSASSCSQPIVVSPEKAVKPLETLKPLQGKAGNPTTLTPPTARPALQVGPKKSTHLNSVSKNQKINIVAPPAPSTPSHPDSGQQQWMEVRRSRRPSSLCGTAGPTVTTLKAVEPRSFIHLWNMESTAEEIRDYLRKLCPVGTCTVTELSPKGDYKSYKIGVPVGYLDTCMSIDVWPVNARIKTWIVYNRKPMGSTNQWDSNHPRQPFRGATATQ